jgi:hypothetical protein
MTLSLAIALFLAATLGADAALQTKPEKKAEADKFVQAVAISGECIKLVHAGHDRDGVDAPGRHLRAKVVVSTDHLRRRPWVRLTRSD